MNDPMIQPSDLPPKSGTCRGDYHLHSCFSPDSNSTPEQIIERCLAERLDCIAITDHNTIAGALEIQRQAPFKVIVGCEVTSRDGHILGLFVSENLKPGMDARSTVRQIHEQGGIAIAPHPFSRLCGRSLGPALEADPQLFDVIEVFNSNNFIAADNRKALEFAQRHGLRTITGSDAHLPRGIGRNVVTMPKFETPGGFLSSLDAAKFETRYHDPVYFAAMLWVDLVWRWKIMRDPEIDLQIPEMSPTIPGSLEVDEC